MIDLMGEKSYLGRKKAIFTAKSCPFFNLSA
jgi:hypothetical protein